MSRQQYPELFLRLWLDPFDFFAQHLQPQPLILGCRQLVACNRERVCCVAESCGIASVQIRVGKDCIQLGSEIAVPDRLFHDVFQSISRPGGR